MFFIFGCSQIGEIVANRLVNEFTIKNIEFLDNSTIMQNRGEYCGFPIRRVDVLKEYNTSAGIKVIVASAKHYEEMIQQLKEYGITSDEIIIPSEIWHDEYEKVKCILDKRKPRKGLNFVIDIAEHCNLNCKSCDHFSPLSNQYYMSFESYEKDISRIASICRNIISEISIEGGEPLLNPEICQYIEVTSHYLPDSKKNIFTNGILLPQMRNDFWVLCQEHNVTLEITKYPLVERYLYNKIEEIASRYDVKINYFSGHFEEKTSMYKPIDLCGTQDKYESFHSCYMANGECADLKNGKIFPCTFVANLHIFNNYFESELEISKKDYLDIYDEELSVDDILDFLCNPVPACRFCKVNEWSFDNKWGISQKTIDEWT